MTAPTVEPVQAELTLLTTYAIEELLSSWPNLSTAEGVRDALAELLPQLVNFYGSAAATLGADWYDDYRFTSGIPGNFRATPAELPGTDRTDSLAGWGVGPLFQAEPNVEDAQAKVAGGFQRIIADAHRDTVIGSIARDPLAKGWRRQTVGETCDFCTMIAGRGAVYSARTALFSSHDDCDCIAVPSWDEQVKVLPYVPSQKLRTPEQRAKNNARIRQHLGRGGAVNVRATETTPPRDIDAERTVPQLRATLASLERSLTLFDSPATRLRIDALRRQIASRT